MLTEGVVDVVGVGTMWRWPLTHRLPVSGKQADLSMRFLQRTLAASGVLASLGLVLRGTPSDGVTAWLTALTLDDTDPETVLLLAAVAAPWLGLGPGVDGPMEPIVGSAMGFTVNGVRAGTHIVPEASTFGRFMSARSHPWQLTVQLGFAAPTEEKGEVEVGVSLVGDATDLSVAAPLLTCDLLGRDDEARLVPEHAVGAVAEEITELAASGRARSIGMVPEGIAGRLLALPARLAGSWALVDVAPVAASAVIDTVHAAVPPHVLVQGGSGQGKTTLLEHLVEASLSAGAAVVVVCPHGDLAERAATRIASHGTPVRIVDYGAGQPVPWNLSVPDPGVDLEEHASLLTEVIRELWHDGDGDWFGPVWYRCMRALISVLVRDPDGPHPITRLPELLAVESPFREAALVRIGDAALTRLVHGELLPMLSSRDPGNTVTWLVAKLDPLIGDPTVRGIVGGRLHAVDVTPVLDGASLVVSVPERHLTADGARALASMVIGRLWLQLRRTDAARPVHLYVDEWQKLPIPALGQMLAEGRKRGLSLRLANQNSAQIPGRLWETAAGNVGAMISFRVGANDARRLGPVFASVSSDQLARLPDHWVACTSGGRDVIAPGPVPLARDGGAALAAGHAATLAAVRGQALGMVHGIAGALARKRSAQRRARPREDLDEWVARRLVARRLPTDAGRRTLWDAMDTGIDLGDLPDPI